MSQITVFLVHALVGLYVMVLLIRLLLQWAQADYYNPVSQAMINLTQPLVGPVQKLLPRTGRFSLATLVVTIVVQMLAIVAIYWLSGFGFPDPLSTFLWSLIGIASKVLNIFFFAIIILVVLSWIAPQSRQPATLLLYQITEPVMGPIRRILPNLGGLDISPIFVLLAIQLIEMAVIYPLARNAFMPQGLIMGL